MDTRTSTSSPTSASEVARELGTSVPRVVRAARRLGFDDRAGAGRLHLSANQVTQLRDVLGCRQRIDGLTDIDTAVLAALARSPLGVTSARSVARKSGVSPTAVSRALSRLADQNLITTERTTIVAGRPRHVRMLHANRRHPRYPELARALAQVQPPRPEREEGVPATLRHLFWNTESAQLGVVHGGDYIARRLLRTRDPAGLAWGARHLYASHWQAAAHARGLDPAVKAMADNLAKAAER